MAAIYDKPVRALMHEFVEKSSTEKGAIFSREQVKQWFTQNYPKIKEGTVNAHLLRMSTNAVSRFHHNPIHGEDDLFFQLDGKNFRLFDSQTDPAPLYNDSEDDLEVSGKDSLDSELGSQEFAYEKDLQNYLARNLNLLEPGLVLYEDEGIRGIEFPAGGRYIDILAVDQNNNFVVVELKVSKGYDRVIGQLLRYVNWIKQNLAENGQTVRGMIVARNISADLILACNELQNVKLYEYELSVSVRPKESELLS